MSATLQSLGIDKLTREERIALVDEIWESIGSEPKPALSEAKRQELIRRVEEDDAFPNDGVPWETVLANTRARLGRK